MFNVLLKVARCLPLPQTCINGTRAAGLEPRGFIGVPTPARSVPRPGVPREAIGQRWQGPACAGAVDGLLGTRRTTSSPGTRSQPQRTPSKPPAFNASPRPSSIGGHGGCLHLWGQKYQAKHAALSLQGFLGICPQKDEMKLQPGNAPKGCGVISFQRSSSNEANL